MYKVYHNHYRGCSKLATFKFTTNRTILSVRLLLILRKCSATLSTILRASQTTTTHLHRGNETPQMQRFEEPTCIGDHCLDTGHPVSLNNTITLVRQYDWFLHKVSEIHHEPGPVLPRIICLHIDSPAKLRHRLSLRYQGMQ